MSGNCGLLIARASTGDYRAGFADPLHDHFLRVSRAEPLALGSDSTAFSTIGSVSTPSLRASSTPNAVMYISRRSLLLDPVLVLGEFGFGELTPSFRRYCLNSFMTSWSGSQSFGNLRYGRATRSTCAVKLKNAKLAEHCGLELVALGQLRTSRRARCRRRRKPCGRCRSSSRPADSWISRSLR